LTVSPGCYIRFKKQYSVTILIAGLDQSSLNCVQPGLNGFEWKRETEAMRDASVKMKSKRAYHQNNTFVVPGEPVSESIEYGFCPPECGRTTARHKLDCLRHPPVLYRRWFLPFGHRLFAEYDLGLRGTLLATAFAVIRSRVKNNKNK